jgi:hypothetical protein
MSGPACSDGLQVEIQWLVQHVSMKEGQGVEDLVLSGGHVLLDGQVSQQGFDLRLAEVGRVALMVKEDKAADPMEVGDFGLGAVMFSAQGIPQLVEQSRLRPWHGISPLACPGGWLRIFWKAARGTTFFRISPFCQHLKAFLADLPARGSRLSPVFPSKSPRRGRRKRGAS